MKNISLFLLERYNLGEVTISEKQIVENAIENSEKSGALKAQILALQKSDNEIRRKYLYDNKASILRYKKIFPRRNIITAAAIASVFVFAAGAFSLYYYNNFAKIQNAEFDVRAKGGGAAGTQLFAYLKTEDGSVLLYNDKIKPLTLHAGDTIQLSYNTDVYEKESLYGIIFSIDGRGQVTLHYPYSEKDNALLETGENILLNEAYTLDDAPFFENFFLLTSKNALNPALILENARKTAVSGGAIEADIKKTFSQYEITELLIKKE